MLAHILCHLNMFVFMFGAEFPYFLLLTQLTICFGFPTIVSHFNDLCNFFFKLDIMVADNFRANIMMVER